MGGALINRKKKGEVDYSIQKLALCAFRFLSVLGFGIVTASAEWAAANEHFDRDNLEQPLQPVTVADSISMTKLLSARAVHPEHYDGFEASPDGLHLAIITKRGNLKTGNNDFRLIVYKTNDILAYVNADLAPEPIAQEDKTDNYRENGAAGTRGKPSLPIGAMVLRLSSDSNEDAIRNVQWLADNKTLAFIGISKDSVSQIYSVNIGSEVTQQLTTHPRSVVAFDIAAESDLLVYVSTAPTYNENRGKPHFIVGENRMYDVMDIDREIRFANKHRYYAQHIGQEMPARPIGEAFDARFPKVWLSPNGRWGIGLMFPKDLPRTLLDYKPIADSVFLKSVIETHKVGSEVAVLSQFVLIDMEGGSVKPVWNVPSGDGLAGASDVHWLTQDRLVLSSTLLPLNVDDQKDRERRRQAVAIVEARIIDRDNQEVTWITDVPHYAGASKYKLLGSRIDVSGTLITKWVTTSGDPLPDKYYRRIEKQGRVAWIEVGDADVAEEHLKLFIQQDLNTPPELFGMDTQTGHRRRITDLNPQFRQLSFGDVEEFTWSDKTGLEWAGGLVYPPGYRRGVRYPLVIQTHGFSKNTFLIDGNLGLASAYAAQPIASRGILVLQMTDAPNRLQGQRGVLQVAQNGIESAIDALDEQELIDKTRVGLIGFSATASQVQNTLTFSQYEFAAATIADSSVPDLYLYIATHGYTASGLTWVENMLGAVPWGDKLSRWVAHSPILHLDLVATPVRIEQYRDYAIPHFWDVYAVLKRQEKPVEYLMIRDGAHALVKPLNRFVSQQGNVDWFDFWLNGRERSEPYPDTPETRASLEEQYKRWRTLREQQEVSKSAAQAARKWYKEQEAKREKYEQWLKEQDAMNDYGADIKEAGVN